jgi:hypothetical protein
VSEGGRKCGLPSLYPCTCWPSPRGGYHRYLGWTMALLPLPRDWEFARHLLAPLATRALEGDVPLPCELLEAATRAYRLRASDVAPLIGWAAR